MTARVAEALGLARAYYRAVRAADADTGAFPGPWPWSALYLAMPQTERDGFDVAEKAMWMAAYRERHKRMK